MDGVELKVEMAGFNGEKRLRRCLSKLKGVELVEVELIKKKVVVQGAADESRVLKTLRRNGFRCEPWCSKTEMLFTTYVGISYRSFCVICDRLL